MDFNLSTLPSWIILILGILGTVFGIYRYFRDPQVRAEKDDALMAQDIRAIRADITNLRDNHLHSLGQALEETNKQVNSLNVQVATLATIIDERIPKKHD